jgi:hypothetical protein
MEFRNLVLAATVALAPLGARAADLVVCRIKQILAE